VLVLVGGARARRSSLVLARHGEAGQSNATTSITSDDYDWTILAHEHAHAHENGMGALARLWG
jgi:hypothetical protein